MTTPATSDDVREVAGAVRDLAVANAELATKLSVHVSHLARHEDILARMERTIASMETLLAPVAAHYEALNKEHASAVAKAAEAGTALRAAEDAAKAEWMAWLTPRRALWIIITLASMLGIGGPVTGMAGRAQRAADAAWSTLMDAEAAEAAPEQDPVTREARPLTSEDR